MSLARANLKTIHGISHNINTTIKRLEDDKEEKEKAAKEFLEFITKDVEDMKVQRKDLELNLKKAINAIDLVDNVLFAKAARSFVKEITDKENFDKDDCEKARDRLLDLWRPLYAQHVQKHASIIYEAGNNLLQFVNKLTHFVDTMRKDAEDYITRTKTKGEEFE